MKFGKQPAPVADINEDDLAVGKPKKEAAGVKAVIMDLERAVAQAGVTHEISSPVRRMTVRALSNILLGLFGCSSRAALYRQAPA